MMYSVLLEVTHEEYMSGQTKVKLESHIVSADDEYMAEKVLNNHYTKKDDLFGTSYTIKTLSINPLLTQDSMNEGDVNPGNNFGWSSDV